MAKLANIRSKCYQHVYDIGVKDNHNYFANDICVHNCMKMAVTIAGFTPTESDHFRKGIKQKDESKFKPWKDKFVAGAKKKSGLDEETALEIWQYIQDFAGYGFNLGHSCVYAIVAYMTAYLKHYYPVYFMTALLSNNADNDKKIKIYLDECKKMNIEILPPAINTSSDVFETNGKKILYPFTAIKSLGKKAVDEIIAERKKDGKFTNFDDFLYRINKSKVRINNIINMIFAGCFRKFGKMEYLFDELMKTRNENRLIGCLNCNYKYAVTPSKVNSSKCPYCESDSIILHEDALAEMKFNRDYVRGEVFGFQFTNVSLKDFAEEIIKEGCNALSMVEEINPYDTVRVAFEVVKVKEHVDKNGNTMAFLDITDGEFDTSCVVFSNDWVDLKEHMKQGNCYISNLSKGNRGDTYVFNFQKAHLLLLAKTV